MKEHNMCLTVLGARGSLPVSDTKRSRFGGATSCYMVQAGSETIFLDGGTGLVSAPARFEKPPVILLSHLHLDHVIGLGMYPRLSQDGTITRLLFRADTEDEMRALLQQLFSPPFWPIPLTEYKGTLLLEPLKPTLRIGDVTVESIEGRHPGGCLVFRLKYGDKRLVYATDCEPDDPFFLKLISFCDGSDLLLYDGQFTEKDSITKKGFGHSTAEKGVELMERCGAKRLLLIHHDPQASDEKLLRRERRFNSERIRYAREGEEIEI